MCKNYYYSCGTKCVYIIARKKISGVLARQTPCANKPWSLYIRFQAPRCVCKSSFAPMCIQGEANYVRLHTPHRITRVHTFIYISDMQDRNVRYQTHKQRQHAYMRWCMYACNACMHARIACMQLCTARASTLVELCQMDQFL
jgi:hypothetical protein